VAHGDFSVAIATALCTCRRSQWTPPLLRISTPVSSNKSTAQALSSPSCRLVSSHLLHGSPPKLRCHVTQSAIRGAAVAIIVVVVVTTAAQSNAGKLAALVPTMLCVCAMKGARPIARWTDTERMDHRAEHSRKKGSELPSIGWSGSRDDDDDDDSKRSRHRHRVGAELSHGSGAV